jgi:PKD repeat protein
VRRLRTSRPRLRAPQASAGSGHGATSPGSRTRDARGRGQSLVEFVLILPVLLLIVLGGIDLGRIFLGWVSLNNTARIAANYAAANALAVNAGNATALTTYNRLVQDDAKATNCTPDNPIPPPTYDPSVAIGGYAVVTVDCRFTLLTPILANIFGGHVDVSAQATFPIRSGVIANGPAGGGGPAPVAHFTATPDTGPAALTVTFADTSTGGPSTWAWDFNGDTVIDSTAQNPPPFTYTAPGTYTARLTVSNGLQGTFETHTIIVTNPPGPIAVFTVSPTSGNAPLVATFTNTSTGTITAWAWDFDGNGTTDSTVQNPPARSYNAGAWVISLKVTDAFNQSSTTTQTLIVNSTNPTCTVPDFKNQQSSNNIQGQWNAAGFSTIVVFNPSRPPDYKISNKQTPSAGSTLSCTSTVITVKN